MPMTPTAVPEISQYALSHFDACERWYELAHLRREPWPAPDPLAEQPDVRRRLGLGDAFHRLARLHARQTPEETLAPSFEGPDGAELEALWRRFLADDVSRFAGPVFAEQVLRVLEGGLRLLVRYDRLERLPDGRWCITDWKTGRAFDPVRAEGSWQTRLYRLALALGGHYFNGGEAIAPEHIVVRYWHVPAATAYMFNYDRATFEADRAKVADIGASIHRGLTDGFSTTPTECPRCPYASRCRLDEPRPTRPTLDDLPVPIFRFPD